MTDILTAAHCVSNGTSESVSLWRSNGLGGLTFLGTFNNTAITVSPDYTYEGDVRDDIAVLEVRGYNHGTANLNPLYLGTISTSSTIMDALGFGSASQYSQTGPILRTGYQFGQFRADWVSERYLPTGVPGITTRTFPYSWWDPV